MVDTPHYGINKEMMDCINRASNIKHHGEAFTSTPIPFCSIHTVVADDDSVSHSLEFCGLSDWNYTKSVPLERMDCNYVINTMRLELVTFMEEWAVYLMQTEVLVESEE